VREAILHLERARFNPLTEQLCLSGIGWWYWSVPVTLPESQHRIIDERVLDSLIRAGRERRRIIAFTGAGISTDSGIPDYRGPGGVWEQRRPPTIGDFLENPESRRAYWERRRHDYPTLASREPNAAHIALARLANAGRLDYVITQNIDGLHQKAGNPPDRVIELHGTAHRIKCSSCGRVYEAVNIQDRLEAGEAVPECEFCGGILRSATILFGESLPKDALDGALAAANACDLMLVVGSSLVVNPAARLPVIAKRTGALLAIVNRTPTPLDAVADIHLLGEAAPVLSAFADGLLGAEATTA
jgi:NAD-dependent deacetylase